MLSLKPSYFVFGLEFCRDIQIQTLLQSCSSTGSHHVTIMCGGIISFSVLAKLYGLGTLISFSCFCPFLFYMNSWKYKFYIQEGHGDNTAQRSKVSLHKINIKIFTYGYFIDFYNLYVDGRHTDRKTSAFKMLLMLREKNSNIDKY